MKFVLDATGEVNVIFIVNSHFLNAKIQRFQ